MTKKQVLPIGYLEVNILFKVIINITQIAKTVTLENKFKLKS